MNNLVNYFLTFIIGIIYLPKAYAIHADTLINPKKDTIVAIQSIVTNRTIDNKNIKTESANPVIEFSRASSESYMQNKVSFFDDFIRRFNHENTSKDLLKVSRENRVEAIEKLFDTQIYRTTNQKKEFQENKSLFLAMIDSVFLKGDSRLPFAEIESEVRYLDKTFPIKLYLKKFLINGVFDWKVIGVISPMIIPKEDIEYTKAIEKDTTHYAINPQAHETNFLSLRTIFTKSGAFYKTIPINLKNDGNLIFLSKLIDKKQIEFEDFDISLYINTQTGWIIKLNYQPRATDDSGWLISDLIQTSKKTRTPQIIENYIKNQNIN